MPAEPRFTTKEIQDKILLIAKQLDAFCREHDIEYYLMGGTALGAMRHKGFIPWDDDFDVFMTYENYTRFIETFESDTPEGFFLQVGGTDEWPLLLSRVCLKGTTFISDEFKNNMLQHHNVFLDVMCLYSAPRNRFSRFIQYSRAQLLRMKALNDMGFRSSKAKNIALNITGRLLTPHVKASLTRRLEQFEGQATEYVGHYFGRARFRQATFPRCLIGKQRYVVFEDTLLPVFEHVEDYLRARFGDNWMEIPSQETRDKYPSHGDFVDLNQDYTRYMSPDRKCWLV